MSKRKYLIIITLSGIIILMGIIIIDIKLNQSIQCFTSSNVLSGKERNNFKTYIVKDTKSLRFQVRGKYIEISLKEIQSNVKELSNKIYNFFYDGIENIKVFLNYLSCNLSKTIDKS